MTECRHPDSPHTVMYWLNDGGPPIPMTARFDNVEDARQFAESGIDQDNSLLRWVKIFRSDNESYTCYQWDNPVAEAKNLTVKVDVDSKEFVGAMNRVRTRLSKYDRSIRNLWIGQMIVSTAVLIHVAEHLFR